MPLLTAAPLEQYRVDCDISQQMHAGHWCKSVMCNFIVVARRKLLAHRENAAHVVHRQDPPCWALLLLLV